MTCLAPDCLELSAAEFFDVEPADPALHALCMSHFRELQTRRAARNDQAIRNRILAMTRPTCYGDGGACPNGGSIYPGGLYCPAHAPSSETTETRITEMRSWLATPAVSRAEPILASRECDEKKMPGTVRSAVKTAGANGWTTRVTIAIDPEGLQSVLFRGRRDDVTLSSRHEGDGTKTLSFKGAWHQRGDRLPLRIGWRELTAALGGADPNDTDRRAMREAVLTVLDAGGDVVEILSTG